MITEPIPSWFVITVMVVALLAGSSCIGTSNVVWFRHRIFGAGGTILSFCGVVLIGLSVWGNVQIEGVGWKLNLERVASALETEPSAVQELFSEISRNDPELSSELARELVARNSQMVFDTVARLATQDRGIRRELLAAIPEVDYSEPELAAAEIAAREVTGTQATAAMVNASASSVPVRCEVPTDDSDVISLKADEYAESEGHPQQYTWYEFEPPSDGSYTIDAISMADDGDTVLSVYGPGATDSRISYDDDSGEGRNSRTNNEFEAHNKYFICVSHYGDIKPFKIIVSKKD